MSDEPVTLDFIAAQQRQLLIELGSLRDDMASFRDDMRLLTAIVSRQDGTLAAMLEQLRLMVVQHQHTADRVRTLEGLCE